MWALEEKGVLGSWWLSKDLRMPPPSVRWDDGPSADVLQRRLGSRVHSFSWAAVTKDWVPKTTERTGRLKLTALEVTSLKSGGGLGHTSKALRDDLSLPLSSFWWWLSILDVPWLIATSLQSLPPVLHGLVLVCLCLL